MYWSTFIVGIVDLGVDLQREITLPNIVSILTFSIIQHKSIHKTENLLTLYIDCPLYFWVLSYSPSPHRFFYAVPEIRAVTSRIVPYIIICFVMCIRNAAFFQQ